MDENTDKKPVDDTAPNELRNIVEAAIMHSEEPITIDRMLGMFTDDTRPERSAVKEVLTELEQDYANRGFELKRIDKGYRLQTREEYSPWLSRLSAGRAPRYSRAMLETLAIIAYRQPVTRGEIEEIRGVAVSTDIIRTLLEREWIRQVGFRDVPGKPALFATTKMFLEYFNLETLSQLPSLMEIRDMDTIAAELNMTLPLEGDGDAADQQGDTAGETQQAANQDQPDLLQEITVEQGEDAPAAQGDAVDNEADDSPVEPEEVSVGDDTRSS